MRLRLVGIALAVCFGFGLATLTMNRHTVRAQALAGSGFASMPGTVGGQDMFGPMRS